jgi:hypothetical protein
MVPSERVTVSEVVAGARGEIAGEVAGAATSGVGATDEDGEGSDGDSAGATDGSQPTWVITVAVTATARRRLRAVAPRLGFIARSALTAGLTKRRSVDRIGLSRQVLWDASLWLRTTPRT